MFFGQLLSMPSFEDCCLTCALEELPTAGNLQLTLRPCKNFSPLHNYIQLRYLCPISNKACLNLYIGQNVGCSPQSYCYHLLFKPSLRRQSKKAGKSSVFVFIDCTLILVWKGKMGRHSQIIWKTPDLLCAYSWTYLFVHMLVSHCLFITLKEHK